MKKLFALYYVIFIASSCVSKKEYEALQKRNVSLSKKEQRDSKINGCQFVGKGKVRCPFCQIPI